MKKICKISIAVLLGLTLTLMGGTVWASATLFVGDAGTFLYDGEVQPISDPTQLTVHYNGGGQPTLDPLTLIIGVPGTCSGPNCLEPGEEVYSSLGLSHDANNSNSWTNWNAANSYVNDISGVNYQLIQYANGSISGGTNASFNLETILVGPVPTGTFVVAYGEYGSKNWSTPFTRSGLVPEPGTLLLLGSGLVGLGLYRRKFKS